MLCHQAVRDLETFWPHSRGRGPHQSERTLFQQSTQAWQVVSRKNLGFLFIWVPDRKNRGNVLHYGFCTREEKQVSWGIVGELISRETQSEARHLACAQKPFLFCKVLCSHSVSYYPQPSGTHQLSLTFPKYKSQEILSRTTSYPPFLRPEPVSRECCRCSG